MHKPAAEFTRALPPLVIASALLLSALSGLKAEAKLGEDYSAYKARVASTYLPNGEKKEGETTNYMFTVKLPPDTQTQSPGYGIGVTISTIGGKITGQSMTVRPGMNPMQGGLMTSISAFAFSWEAIGKPAPADRAKAEAHFKGFTGAVTAAFLGQAQNVRYPGYAGIITLRRDPGGNLLVVVKK